MFSSLRQDYRERLRRRSRRYTGQPFPRVSEPVAEAPAAADDDEAVDAAPVDTAAHGPTEPSDEVSHPQHEHAETPEAAPPEETAELEPGAEAEELECEVPELQPDDDAGLEAEAVPEELVDELADDDEWDVDAYDDSADLEQEEPAAEAAEVEDQGVESEEFEAPLPLDEALEAGQTSGVLIALHREVSDLADRIFRGVNGRQPEVWAVVRESDWYGSRRESLDLKPLEEFYALLELANDELKGGSNGDELRGTLADLEFSRLLLSVRDLFVDNIPSWGRRSGWWSTS